MNKQYITVFIHRIYTEGLEYTLYNSFWITTGGAKVSGFKIATNFDFKFWISFGHHHNLTNIEKL